VRGEGIHWFFSLFEKWFRVAVRELPQGNLSMNPFLLLLLELWFKGSMQKPAVPGILCRS